MAVVEKIRSTPTPYSSEQKAKEVEDEGAAAGPVVEFENDPDAFLGQITHEMGFKPSKRAPVRFVEEGGELCCRFRSSPFSLGDELEHKRKERKREKKWEAVICLPWCCG